MTGVATGEAGAGRSFEGVSTGQQQSRCQSGEAIAEWRSSEQVENGSPSTSPPYWDSDDDDDGGVPFFSRCRFHSYLNSSTLSCALGYRCFANVGYWLKIVHSV